MLWFVMELGVTSFVLIRMVVWPRVPPPDHYIKLHFFSQDNWHSVLCFWELTCGQSETVSNAERSEVRKTVSVNGEWREWEDSAQKARNNPQIYNLHKAFIFTRFERSGRASVYTMG